MITNGSIIKAGKRLYLILGIVSYTDFKVSTVLSNLDRKPKPEEIKETLLSFGITYAFLPYEEDMFDRVMPNDFLVIKNGLFLLEETKRIDKKTLDLWITKSKFQSSYLMDNFPDLYDIETVRKERLDYMKEHWYDFISFVKGDYEQKPCKRVTKNMLYSYKVRDIVFYAIALGNGKFLNLSTKPVEDIMYYIGQNDVITLKDEILYNTGVNCSFIEDLK